MTWFFVFDFEGNPVSFLKEKENKCKRSVLQKESYDKFTKYFR